MTTTTLTRFEMAVQEVLRKSVLQLRVAPSPYLPPFECVDASVEQLFRDDGARLKDRACRRMGWTPAMARRVFEEYKKFLTLKAAAHDWNSDLLLPPPLIDEMWRLHVVDNHEYSSACLAAFGKVIQHDPDGDIDRTKRIVGHFASAAAVRARFADGFDAEIWRFGQPLQESAQEPAPKRRRYDDDDATNNSNVITVRIRDDLCASYSHLKRRDSTNPDDELQASYKRRTHNPPGTVQFLFDACQVQPGQTPKCLSLADADVILAMPDNRHVPLVL